MQGARCRRGDSADELACGDEINSPAGSKKVDPQLTGGEDGSKDRPLGLGKVETVHGKRGEWISGNEIEQDRERSMQFLFDKIKLTH